jgi:hypothetical protein
MSVIEPVCIWIVRTEGDHANIWDSFPPPRAAVISPPWMLLQTAGDSTGGRLPIDIMAEQHPVLHSLWPRSFQTGSSVEACHVPRRRIGPGSCRHIPSVVEMGTGSPGRSQC